MTTENYAIGYEDGKRDGFNEGVDEGHKAATSRQEAKIKALRESLQWALSNISEEPYEWACEEDSDAHTAAIALSKEAT